MISIVLIVITQITKFVQYLTQVLLMDGWAFVFRTDYRLGFTPEKEEWPKLDLNHISLRASLADTER